MGKKSSKAIMGIVVAILAGALGLSTQKDSDIVQQITGIFESTPQASKVADVPEYDGKHQEIEINNNQPNFSKEDLSFAMFLLTSLDLLWKKEHGKAIQISTV